MSYCGIIILGATLVIISNAIGDDSLREKRPPQNLSPKNNDENDQNESENNLRVRRQSWQDPSRNWNTEAQDEKKTDDQSSFIPADQTGQSQKFNPFDKDAHQPTNNFNETNPSYSSNLDNMTPSLPPLQRRPTNEFDPQHEKRLPSPGLHGDQAYDRDPPKHDRDQQYNRRPPPPSPPLRYYEDKTHSRPPSFNNHYEDYKSYDHRPPRPPGPPPNGPPPNGPPPRGPPPNKYHDDYHWRYPGSYDYYSRSHDRGFPPPSHDRSPRGGGPPPYDRGPPVHDKGHPPPLYGRSGPPRGPPPFSRGPPPRDYHDRSPYDRRPAQPYGYSGTWRPPPSYYHGPPTYDNRGGPPSRGRGPPEYNRSPHHRDGPPPHDISSPSYDRRPPSSYDNYETYARSSLPGQQSSSTESGPEKLSVLSDNYNSDAKHSLISAPHDQTANYPSHDNIDVRSATETIFDIDPRIGLSETTTNKDVLISQELYKLQYPPLFQVIPVRPES